MPLLRIETEPRRAEPKPAEEDAKQDNLDLTSLPPIPQWGLRDPAAAPETETPWSLEVIKNGTVVDTCELPASQRGRYVLGRAKERVHVHLEHASISRLHGARARARATRPRVDLSTEPCPPPARSAAVLQHSTDGKLFAFDMNSAHGTHLNKARMPACGFVEVKDGDVLVFGESTRVYVLHGPAAASDAATGNVAFGAAVPTREKDKRRVVGFSAGALAAADGAAPAAADGAALRSRLGEADWGLAIDADDATAADSEREAERAAAMRGPDDSGEGASDEQLPDYLKNDPLFRKYRTASASVGEKEVHERDLKLFEKLQAKITKMNNIQNENKRILAKARASARARAPPSIARDEALPPPSPTQDSAQGGLGDGQRAAVARNDERLADLAVQIEELEDQIRQKNRQRADGANARKGDGASAKPAARDDDDDFYDRTARGDHASGANWRIARKQRRFGGRGAARHDAEPEAAAETEASLEARHAQLVERLAAATAELNGLDAPPNTDAGEDGSAARRADPLDHFMSGNRTQRSVERRAEVRATRARERARARARAHAREPPSLPQLTRECARLESEIGPVAQLLAIARPALSGLGSVRSDAAVSSSPVSAPEPEATAPVATAAHAAAAPASAEAPVGDLETSMDSVYSGSNPGDAGAIEHRASGRETVAPTSEPAPDADAVVVEAAAKRKSHGPTMPPPKKARNTATTVSAAIATSARPLRPAVPPTSNEAALLEGGDADWVPPQNQTGDGRTALNDKFGY